MNSSINFDGQVLKDYEVLIDVVDQVLLDHAKCPDNHYVVGLTATKFTESLQYERKFLKHHRFSFLESSEDVCLSMDGV